MPTYCSIDPKEMHRNFFYIYLLVHTISSSSGLGWLHSMTLFYLKKNRFLSSFFPRNQGTEQCGAFIDLLLIWSWSEYSIVVVRHSFYKWTWKLTKLLSFISIFSLFLFLSILWMIFWVRQVNGYTSPCCSFHLSY